MTDALTRFGVTYSEVASPQTLTQGDGDTLENDIALSDDEQYLILAVTMSQYTNLLSAALNGANRHWPQEYLEVVYPLIKAGKLLLCETVAECFETSEAFQTALANYLATNGYGSGSGTPLTPSYYNADGALIDGSLYSSCNNDMLFGAITELTDFMNTAITDLLEMFVASTIGPQNTSTLLSAIPIVNQLPFDEMIDFLTQLAYTLKLSYSGQYTSALRDEIRCDLFCMTKDTCTLNFQDWADYFATRAGVALSNVSFVDAIGWFLTGTFAGEAVVWAAHALFAQVLAYGAQWMNIDAAYMTKIITSAMNNPDSDWQTLCDDCTDLCYVWDFTIDDRGWTVWTTGDRPFGVYTSGVGWQCTYNNVSGSGYDNRIYIENLNWASTVVPIGVQMDIVPTAGGALRGAGLRTCVGTANNTSASFGTWIVNSVEQTVSCDYTIAGNGIRINVTTDTEGASDIDAITIKRIRLYYSTGTPEDGAACS